MLRNRACYGRSGLMITMHLIRRAHVCSTRILDVVRGDYWATVFVATCTIATFFLGTFHLGVPSVWGDEAASISISSQNGSALFRAISHDGGNLSLYYLVLHVILKLFGTGTDTLRMVSVACATLLTPGSYLLGKAVFSRRAGLFSAALMAISLPVLNWAQQMRGYDLVALLLTASSLALVIALRDGRKRMFVIYGVFAVLSCYTELLAGFVIVAQLIAVLFHPRFRASLKYMAALMPAMIVALLPLAVIATARGANQLFWLARPNILTVREDIAFLSSARPNTLTTSSSHLLTEATVILLCVGFVAGIIQAKFTNHRTVGFGVILAGLWLVLPPAIAYAISLNYHPVFYDHYFVMCIPGMTLILAYVLSIVPLMPLSWACCAAIIFLRAEQLPNTYNISIDNWRLATTTVINESAPGDCIAFYFNDGFADFAYYLEHPPAGMRRDAPIPRPVLPALTFGSDPRNRSLADYPAIVESYKILDTAQIALVAATCPVLFVLVNHDGNDGKTPGAKAVSTNLITLRNRLQHAYGASTSKRLQSIRIFTYFHLNATPRTNAN